MAVGLGGHALHCHGPRARPAQSPQFETDWFHMNSSEDDVR